MNHTFQLTILSANRTFFSGRCTSLVVPAYNGEKEILANHENMVIAVNEGEIRIRPENETAWTYAVIGEGFVQIANNRVTLLVETAERPEEINIARARKAKERAEEEMRQKQSIQEYYSSRASLARAMSRLRLAEKHK
ncbi:MAG: ATP synthase F1 subunit epsilon [Lachnospiraceae bacterium]|nr:ATP synthase F1 subunit epsilon [Lachnospiraceae bacterium]